MQRRRLIEILRRRSGAYSHHTKHLHDGFGIDRRAPHFALGYSSSPESFCQRIDKRPLSKNVSHSILGLSLWVVYGVFQSDIVIIGGNALSASLVATVLLCKLRDMRSDVS